MTSRTKGIIAAGALVGASLFSLGATAAPKITLMHVWGAGSDAEAVATLGKKFEEAGGTWNADLQTNTALFAKLRADIVTGTPAAAVQLKGPQIAEWAPSGVLASISDLATSENWDAVVAPVLQDAMKSDGQWVAVPMNIHRINWLYGSKAAMDKAGVTEMPKTWADFNAACDKAVAAGIVCFGHTADSLWNAILFDVILYGQDPETYRKAFTEADIEAMQSEGMIRALDQLRLMVTKYMDPGVFGRSPWDVSLQMVSRGEAMFTVMGDWATGMFISYGNTPGEDVLCAQAPQDWEGTGFLVNSDSVAFFKQNDPESTEGQQILAKLIMDPAFQLEFNKTKGSIPARTDVDISGFNTCQQQAQVALKEAIEQDTVALDMAVYMAVPDRISGALSDVINQFVAAPEMSSADAARDMADAVEALQ